MLRVRKFNYKVRTGRTHQRFHITCQTTLSHITYPESLSFPSNGNLDGALTTQYTSLCAIQTPTLIGLYVHTTTAYEICDIMSIRAQNRKIRSTTTRTRLPGNPPDPILGVNKFNFIKIETFISELYGSFSP